MRSACILPIALACAVMGGASLTLSACTHDYDVFKPRGDAGADGASRASGLETSGEEEDDDGAPDAGL